MKKSRRTEIARETVEIVDRGYYVFEGKRVDISDVVKKCHSATKLVSEVTLKSLRDTALASSVDGHDTKIEIVNETTLEGLTRLIATEFSPVAVLNFASARNPGGGFLKGSQAQEESLARSSALHSSLIKVFQFYEDHRNNSSSLYSDNMILSPDCPVFRNDDGDLLSEPQIATFITSPAPNAGATAENRPGEMGRIPEILQSRSELILALAASHGYKQLILGAWGCGVFRNSPSAVAKTFATHLLGAWAGRFQRVVFSVYDTSSAKETYSAFKAAFPATS